MGFCDRPSPDLIGGVGVLKGKLPFQTPENVFVGFKRQIAIPGIRKIFRVSERQIAIPGTRKFFGGFEKQIAIPGIRKNCGGG